MRISDWSSDGSLPILGNNAGGVRHRPFVDQTDGNWQRVIDLNLMSMLAATQEAARIMRQDGAIVNIASTEALRAAPGFSVYAACKAAMEIGRASCRERVCQYV